MGTMAIESEDGSAARRRWPLRVAALYAGVFGALTIRAGALALFGDIDVGAAVPFVLWFNFFAGFAYLADAVGLWMARPWATGLAIAIAACTALVFGAFGLHVASAGAYEMRTVAAMSLRTASWCAIALLSWWQLRR
jgi:hypothetical protein